MRTIHECPKCGCTSDKVIDSRDNYKGFKARRRECVQCGTRWSTYEMNTEEFEKLTCQQEIKHLRVRLKLLAKSLNEMGEKR